ncbi:MAG TPA: hypothetical protein VF612_11570 [Jatrophihabitans sp.]|uniref:MvdC/MvdD family ATP grasp protein n=1 Tax=Jatrophihabitans sp. TaxID=1932789 RepID=UPI002EE4BE89
MSVPLIREAILVLTQDPDPTADVVLDRLREMGLPAVRFDTAHFPHPDQMTARWRGGELEAILHTPDADVQVSSLRSVWYRRPREFSFAEEMTPDTDSFARAEARQGFSGMLVASPAMWMNRPHAESVASLKLVQLQAAGRHGLRIPETLVTNRPEEARAFLEADADGQPTIYKRLSSMLLFTHDGQLTAFQTEKVDSQALERLDHVAVTPCLFQRYVPKAYEVRATVVGEQVFAARVDSQSSSTGALDWRVDTELTWEPYRLPEDIEQSLRDLVCDLGLRFGAVDLIRRPDGEYVYLEVNPSGQWAWFQDEITHAIRDAIIEQLANPPDDARGPALRMATTAQPSLAT